MVIYRLPPAFAAAQARARRAVLLTVAVALGGCAVLPSQVERPVSYARQARPSVAMPLMTTAAQARARRAAANAGGRR